MSAQNPYNPPSASLEQEHSNPVYQPEIFTFQGRIGRLRYIAYYLGANTLLMLFIAVLMALFADSDAAPMIANIGIVAIYIVSLVLSIMFTKRRLNDLNRSGWWFLLYLVPVLNLILGIYLIFFSGTDSSNDYGPMPSENPLIIKIIAFIVPIVFFGGILAAIAIPAYQDYMIREQQQQIDFNQ